MNPTEHYIQALTGDKETVMDWRAICDKKVRGAMNIRGSYRQVRDKLSELNADGYGIFATVNETDGKGVKKVNVTRCRAVWCDIDGLSECPETTDTFSVTTRNGWHLYFVLEDCTYQTAWAQGMNKVIAARLGGDLNAVDISRVLRVPGFYHNKGDPFMVEIGPVFSYYTPEMLEAEYGPPPEDKPVKKVLSQCASDEDTPLGIERGRKIAHDLSEVPQGQGIRNSELNRKSYMMGSLVAAGMLSEDSARGMLYDAIEKNYSDQPSGENEATLSSGFNSGLQNPWEEDESFKIGSFVSRHKQSDHGRPTETSNGFGSLLTGTSATDAMMKELEWRKKMGFNPAPGPLVQLDSVLGGGLPAGAVSLLGAPPGQGKSSLALDWCIGCARRGTPTLFCSLELAPLDLYSRAATLEHKKNWLQVRKGDHVEQLRETMDSLAKLPFYVATRDTLHGVNNLVSYIEQIREKYGRTPIVGIDYIQLMANSADVEKRAAMDSISISVREAAKKTAANILCITSVGRAGYSIVPDDSNFPDIGMTLKIAKETGQLEFDAEVVMGIQLGLVDPDDGAQYGWICVGKNRSGGSVGFVGVRYEGLSGQFFDASEDEVVRSWSKLKEIERTASERRRETAELEQERKVVSAIRDSNCKNERDVASACGFGMTACSKVISRLKKQGVILSPTRAELFYRIRGEI